MAKTERYMWLANDLLLTAAAVSLIINLVGQTASGYAFSGILLAVSLVSCVMAWVG